MKTTYTLLALLALLPVACADGEDEGEDNANNANNANNGDGTACAQAASFRDVSSASAGDAYPAPSLNVTCDADAVIIQSNGIPDFEFVPTTPNPLTEQALTFRIPRDPAFADAPSPVPLTGASAVAVNGLPIFGPTEAPNDGYKDPVLDQLLDFCNGHTAPGGIYHLHARPDCLFSDAEGNTHLVLGFAFDGFPILAPWICEDEGCTSTRKALSSWQRLPDHFDANGEPRYDDVEEGAWDIHAYVEGSGDLDECNGRTLDDGSYAYYATDTFPYFMGCYRGAPTANNVLGMGGPGGPPPGGR